MLREIAYFLIFGKPVVLYLGILTLASFAFTALVGFLNFKGIRAIPFKWHPRLALFSLTLGIIHGLLGLSLYFNIF